MSLLEPTTAPPPLTTTMRAAVLVEPGRMTVQEVAIPEPKPGEVRVKLEGCGICASNIPPWQGRPWFQYPLAPGALGHEGWGVIDQVGPGVAPSRVGQRVAMLSNNAYAEYDVTSESSLLHLPQELGDQPFPGEPLGCAMNIFQRSAIQQGDTVAIVGIGFLGALLTELASRLGARVIAIGRRAEALEHAKRNGAAVTIPMQDHGQIIEEVRQLTGGRFCDVVIEAVGKQWPLDLAGELTRERGRLVIAGYHQDGLRQVNLQLWNWRGLDVINAHERDPAIYLQGIAAAAAAVAGGRLHPAPLYTHVLPLEELGHGLTLTEERPAGFMKALIRL